MTLYTQITRGILTSTLALAVGVVAVDEAVGRWHTAQGQELRRVFQNATRPVQLESLKSGRVHMVCLDSEFDQTYRLVNTKGLNEALIAPEQLESDGCAIYATNPLSMRFQVAP